MSAIFESVCETKVIRRRWKIRAWRGLTSGDLAEAIANVPRSAKLVDFDDEDGEHRVWVFELEAEA